MQQVKVSVVIPVYNTEGYVAETLNCILSQELTEIEVLVIDDGSTDNSYSIICEIAAKDDRVRIFKQENKGQGASRNLGLKNAKGEFIYFMDSDDLLSKEALLQCYEKSKSWQLDFLFFDAEVFGLNDTDIKFNYSRTHQLNDGVYSGLTILKKLMDIKGYRVPVWLNFVKLSFLNEAGLSFYEDIHHEDQLFTLYLFVYAQRVGLIKSPFFKRRVRPNSTMTSRFARSNAESYFIIASRLIDLKKQRNNLLPDSIADTLLTDMINDVLYSARIMNKADRKFILTCILKDYIQYCDLRRIMTASFPSLAKLKKELQLQ